MGIEKIRVLLVVQNWGIGGSVQVVRTLWKTLNRDKFEVKVLVLKSKEESDIADEERDVIFINAVDNQKYSFMEYLKTGFSSSYKRRLNTALRAIYEDFNPSIIHLHTPLKESMIAFIKDAKSIFAFTQHQTLLISSELERIKNMLLYSSILKHVHLISVSKKVQKSIDALKIVPLSKRVISNGININEFRFVHRDFVYENLRFIYVARLIAGKGHDILLKAWKNFNINGQFHLDIIGEGDLKHELMALCQQLEVCSSVSFWGEQRNVEPFLMKAHIGVFPSLSEGHPIALLEMMSSGLPVIVSNGEEFLEIIRPGKTGFVFQKGDSYDLAEKMRNVIVDRTQLLRISKAAHEDTISRFSMAHFVCKMEKFYEEIVV